MTQPITDAAKKAAETIHRDRSMLVMSQTVGIIQSAIDTATADLRAEKARMREALKRIERDSGHELRTWNQYPQYRHATPGHFAAIATIARAAITGDKK